MLDAMTRGRMYAVRQKGDERLSLDYFTISDLKSGREATMGEALESRDFPELKIKVRSTKGTEQTAHLSIIRNGLEIKQESITLPHEIVWRDVDVNREEGPVFYRLRVLVDSSNYLVSNPIFVRFSEEIPKQVAALPKSILEDSSSSGPIKPEIKFPKSPTMPLVKLPKKLAQGKLDSEIIEPPLLESIVEKANSATPKVPEPNTTLPELPALPNLPSKSIPITTQPNIKKLVVAKINGVSLKNGPGPKFPEVGRLNKGDSLPLIRSTTIKFNGRPWLMVDADGRKAYVWSKLVATE